MVKNVNIFLISLQQKPTDWVAKGVDEYKKRLTAVVNDIVLRPPSRTLGKTVNELKKIEAGLINTALLKIKPQIKIIFDEKGKSYSSVIFAQKLEQYLGVGKVAFIIGGADGFSDEFKNSVDGIISLSAMTMPHELVRLVVYEQIYRAVTIINHHPYHRQ